MESKLNESLCIYCGQARHGRRKVKMPTDNFLVKAQQGHNASVRVPNCLIGQHVKVIKEKDVKIEMINLLEKQILGLSFYLNNKHQRDTIRKIFRDFRGE